MTEKQLVDATTSRLSNKLTKCPVDNMSSWPNDLAPKISFDLLWLVTWRVDNAASSYLFPKLSSKIQTSSFLGALIFGQFATSSTCHFVNLPFHRLVILWTCHFINLLFRQLVILSTCHFTDLSFCQLATSSTCHFANLPLHQLVNLLLTKCPIDKMSNWQYVQM